MIVPIDLLLEQSVIPKGHWKQSISILWKLERAESLFLLSTGRTAQFSFYKESFMKTECYCCCSFDCGNGITVWLAPKPCLVAKDYYCIVWKILSGLALSRRSLAEQVVDIFRDRCCADLRDDVGNTYYLPEFDDVFTADESCRWFGRYLYTDGTNAYPRYFSRNLARLELLDLAAKLVDPFPFRAIGYVC